jgi:hypothetical protein
MPPAETVRRIAGLGFIARFAPPGTRFIVRRCAASSNKPSEPLKSGAETKEKCSSCFPLSCQRRRYGRGFPESLTQWIA